IGPIKIVGRRSERNVGDAMPRIDRHLSPVVVAADVFPCIFRPGVIAELAGARYRVEGPHKLSVAHVVRTNVSRWRQVSFAGCAAEDDEILENLSRSVR